MPTASEMDVDTSDYAREVASLNLPCASSSRKRTFSDFSRDIPAQEPPLLSRGERKTAGFLTIFAAIISAIVAAFRGPVVIASVPASPSGAKRRAVQVSPSPARRLPGAYISSPAMAPTPPASRPGSSSGATAPEMPAPATAAAPPPPPPPPAAEEAPPRALTWRERRGPSRPRHLWRPILDDGHSTLLSQQTHLTVPVPKPPYRTPITPASSRLQTKILDEQSRNNSVTKLVERAQRILTVSPEARAIRSEQRREAERRRQFQAEEEARQQAQQAEAAKLKAIQEELAEQRKEDERIREEAKALEAAHKARLAEIAAQEEEERQAREAEEAADQFRQEQNEYEQLQAQQAAAAADLEQQRQILIRPLEPKWDSKVKEAMESKSDSAILATTVDGVELSRRDFGSLLPKPDKDTSTVTGFDNKLMARGWLNDEIVNAFFSSIVADKKTQTSWSRGKIPAFGAFNSAWTTNVRKKGMESIKGWAKRQGFKGDKLLQMEKLFLPINTGAHWMLLIINPKTRTIEYIDSLPNPPARYFRVAREYLQQELGSLYVADEWTESPARSSLQDNNDDCGAFTCLNGLAAAKGYGYGAVEAKAMEDGRKMIGAILLNGGFSGDWKL